MFKRNDGLGVNAIQNKFTAMLKTSLHNYKVDYLKGKFKIYDKEVDLEDYCCCLYDENDYVETIIDYDTVNTALKPLTDRERKIVLLHIIEDKDFFEVGKLFGLTYKGTATAFYRAMEKLRESLG